MTPSTSLRAGRALAVAAVASLTLAACASSNTRGQAPVEIRGSSPTGAAAPTAPSGPVATAPRAPSASGIVSYDGYEAIVARDGDTVTSVAGRVGLAASELGAYNGLAPNQPLRAGDELVLPPRPGGYGATTQVAAADPTLSGGQPPVFTAAPDTGSNAATIESAPIGADTGTTAASGAATAPAWSPSLAAAAIDRSNEPAASQPAADAGAAAPGARSPDAPLTLPPSSGQPLPPEPESRPELASPNLDQYQTPAPGARAPTAIAETERQADEAAAEAEAQLAATSPAGASGPEIPGLRLVRPVSGPIVVGYNTWGAGGTRSEGVDFGGPVGTSVAAAAGGTVALVSPSLGGLGTIVVVRHQNELLTVYGRIDTVTVAKGARVQPGQVIGKIAPPPPNGGEPRVHFELRRGAVSVDPTPYF